MKCINTRKDRNRVLKLEMTLISERRSSVNECRPTGYQKLQAVFILIQIEQHNNYVFVQLCIFIPTYMFETDKYLQQIGLSCVVPNDAYN